METLWIKRERIYVTHSKTYVKTIYFLLKQQGPLISAHKILILPVISQKGIQICPQNTAPSVMFSIYKPKDTYKEVPNIFAMQ